MDGLLEALLRLEDAKHKALIEFDAPAYEEQVRQQRRLLSEASAVLPDAALSPDRLLVLAQLIQLNSQLLQNLALINPVFHTVSAS